VKQISTQVVNGEGVTKMTVGIGTAGYMPSEQSRGSPRLSSDVYAVGMIGIQALTGLMPHQLEEDIQTAEIRWQHLVSVSPALADVLDRMVRYDFRQRYQSAVDALAAVQNLNNTYAPTQTSTTPGYTPTLPMTHPGDNAYLADPPLHSPPPNVPAQYRQEIPQQSVSSPPPVTTKTAKVGLGFYLQWVLVNVVGLIAGTFIGAIAQMLVQPFGTIISNLTLAAAMGLTIGYMQALVLRRQIPISENQWIWGTTFGVCLSLILSGKNTENSLFWVGPVVGIIQWWILRSVVKQAGWWVLVNTLLGWIGGIISGGVLILLLQNPKDV
jgi:serine/threonine-protein kinase